MTTPTGYTPAIWGYEGSTESHPFGDTTTYGLGLSWLYEDCQTVQDWGAGMAYGRRYCPEDASYLAVDGSPTSEPFVDVVCELTEWKPDPRPDGIFMRHILEHNEWGWKQVLAHALESFTRRFCLVVFTPFGPVTQRIRPFGDPYTDLSFSLQEMAGQLNGFHWKTQTVTTQTQYATETLFYIRPLDGASSLA